MYKLLFLLSVFISLPAYSVSHDVSGTITASKDCSAALVSTNSRYTSYRNFALSNGCSITEDSAPHGVHALGGAFCDVESGLCGRVEFTLKGVDVPNSNTCASFIGYDGVDNWGANISLSCQDGEPTVECPSGSSKSGDGADLICHCNVGLVSYDGVSCENVKADPCPPIVAQCEEFCSSKGGVQINRCNSTDGELVGEPYCHCKGKDDKNQGKCDPESGNNCATAEKQDVQTTALNDIKTSTDGVTASVDSLKDKLVSQTDKLNDTLTTIANSPGVKSAGGGSGTEPADQPSKWGGSGIDFSTIPTFAGKREAVNQAIESKKAALETRFSTFSNVGDGFITSFGSGGQCPRIDFSGTYLSGLSGNLCSTPIFDYIRYALIFMASVIGIIILLRKS